MMDLTNLTEIERVTRRQLREMQLELGGIRSLVDLYYQVQKRRVGLENAIRASNEAGEPTTVLDFFYRQLDCVERNIRTVLDAATSDSLSQWAKSVIGIGPVLAAGLRAHIDINRAPTASSVWRYAGLDPTLQWHAGSKRPWNAALKRLCWLIGESFVKTQHIDGAFYGQLYAQRRAWEEEQNNAGRYKDQAQQAASRVGKDTVAYGYYSQGKLPPGHLYQRAKRWVVKLFLAHYWEIGRRIAGLPAPRPWVLVHGGHVDYVPPPNWP